MYSRGAHSSKVASFTWANSQSEAICTPLLPVDASAFSLLQDKRIGVSQNKINKCCSVGCPYQTIVLRPICITLLNLKLEICMGPGIWYTDTYALCFWKPICNNVCSGVRWGFMLLQMRVGVWFLRGGSVAIITIYNSHLIVFDIYIGTHGLVEALSFNFIWIIFWYN